MGGSTVVVTALIGLVAVSALLIPSNAGAHTWLPLSFEGQRIVTDRNSPNAIRPCTSPIEFCTEGAQRGKLEDTPIELLFHLDVDVLEAPFSDSPLANVSLYVARVTLILDDGEIHILENGVFDPLPDPSMPLPPGTGLFAAHQRVSGGTGRFRNATGTLSVVGSSKDVRTFPVKTSGTVCVDAD